MDQVFKLRTEEFEPYRARLLLRLLIVFSILVAGVLLQAYLKDHVDFSLIFPLLIIITVSAAIIRRRLHQQRLWWISYELTVSDHSITRRAQGYDDLAIQRSSIAKIIESGKGDMLIQGESRTSRILVPRGLDNRPSFRQLVSDWHLIQPDRFYIPGLHIFAALFGMALILGTFETERAILIVPSATLLVAVLLIAAWSIRRDNTLKIDRRIAWVCAIPSVLAIIRAWQVLHR